MQAEEKKYVVIKMKVNVGSTQQEAKRTPSNRLQKKCAMRKRKIHEKGRKRNATNIAFESKCAFLAPVRLCWCSLALEGKNCFPWEEITIRSLSVFFPCLSSTFFSEASTCLRWSSGIFSFSPSNATTIKILFFRRREWVALADDLLLAFFLCVKMNFYLRCNKNVIYKETRQLLLCEGWFNDVWGMLLLVMELRVLLTKKNYRFCESS